MKNTISLWWNIMFCLLLIGFSGCKGDDEGVASVPHNPNAPVTITGFTPESGGAKTQMVIYGSNFGNDTTIVDVKVGGKDAVLISVKNDCLYCFTPKQAGGKVEVKIGESEPAVSEKEFTYEYKMMVSTLCGYVDELGQGSILNEGSFDELEKIPVMIWLSLDPKNNDMLYLTQDPQAQPLKEFDLKNRYMKSLYTGKVPVTRCYTIDWEANGDNMIVATPYGEDKKETVGVSMFKRDEGFSKPHYLAYMPKCHTLVVDKLDGKVYYSDYTKGELRSYDYNKYGMGNNYDANEEDPDGENQDMVFKFADGAAVRFMVCHPEGQYMYLLDNARSTILRSDYDAENKTFTAPYVVCGGNGAGYEDRIGVQAKLNQPVQGVFVKNKEYAGRDDEYDFYFCDSQNHCIRILSPDGIVSTFAGRGSKSMAGVHGYVDGDLREDARFNTPYGIAYDEVRQTFYVADRGNNRIRKIAYEDGYYEQQESETENEENTNQ